MAKQPLNIGLDTLDAIEELWTGNTRLSQPFTLTDTSFNAVITYAAYMKPSWEQVRELYVVAIARDAFQPLVDFSGLRPRRGKTRVPVSPPTETEAISKTISSVRDSCRLSTLKATINRVHKRLGSNVVTLGDTGFVADNGEFWDVVQYMYIYFKKGTFEPSEPFFRVSQRFERIQARHSRIAPLQQDDSNAAAILVYGAGRRSDEMRSKQSDVCVFLLQDPIKVPDDPTLAGMLKETFESHDVYHTTRDNGTSNPKTKARLPWNLENTYGIYTLDREFVRWITDLGSSPPTRQGSPRDSVLSGRHLLQRCYSPWTDVRRPYSDKSYRLYMIYKIMTTEIRYWTNVAKRQRRAGISCCRCCAATDRLVQHDVPGDDGEPKRLEICEDCEGELWVPNHPRWVSDALMGKRRIRWRPLTNFIFHGDDGELIHHPSEPLRVLQRSERWYRKLSHFRGLEKPFRDMSELHDQAASYHAQWSGKSRSRFRLRRYLGSEQHLRGFTQRDSRDKDIYTSDEDIHPSDIESHISIEESDSGNKDKNATG
jgi:hypothetical protein